MIRGRGRKLPKPEFPTAEVTVPYLVGLWEEELARAEFVQYFIEHLQPPQRAGLLLSLNGGHTRSAFDFAYEATLTAAEQHAPSWLETVNLLAMAQRHADETKQGLTLRKSNVNSQHAGIPAGQ